MARSLQPQNISLYGTPQPLSNQSQPPIQAQRAPTTLDVGYTVGQLWVDVPAQTLYILTAVGGGEATWALLTSGTGAVLELAGGTGTATPTDGVITLAGTTNEITTTASSSTVTFSIPSTFVAPGTITATSGNITATNGNLHLSTAGNKLLIATGSNASVGVTSAMSGDPGAVTVTSTAVTTSSIILYSRATTGGTAGNVSITAQTTGSFTLTSTSTSETSTFNYLIIN